MVNDCTVCGGRARTSETRHYITSEGLEYSTRRKICQTCGARWSTREVRDSVFKALSHDLVPPERKEEYAVLMKKLRMPRREVLAIMGLYTGEHHAAEKG
jgi:hypothetical protein